MEIREMILKKVGCFDNVASVVNDEASTKRTHMIETARLGFSIWGEDDLTDEIAL